MARKNWLVAGGLAITVIIAIVVVFVFFTLRLPLGPEVVLPMLVITGVITLLASLSIVAVAFAALNLTDTSQALGLPEGSVRAVIALGLIVIFFITVVFLYADLASVETRESIGISQAQLDAIPREQIVSQVPNPDGGFNVELRFDKSQASEDFAKQVLTALITLVTAVAAFYFGTRAVAIAQGTVEQPALHILTPRPEPPPTMPTAIGTRLPIMIDTTPKGEAVTWDPPDGDSDGELVQVGPGRFEYRRGSAPGARVTLRFRLVNYPEVSAELVVLAPGADQPPVA